MESYAGLKLAKKETIKKINKNRASHTHVFR
jgi:hypothetical protein